MRLSAAGAGFGQACGMVLTTVRVTVRVIGFAVGLTQAHLLPPDKDLYVLTL